MMGMSKATSPEATDLLIQNLVKVLKVVDQLSEQEATYTAGRLDGLLDALTLRKVMSA